MRKAQPSVGIKSCGVLSHSLEKEKESIYNKNELEKSRLFVDFVLQ